MFLLRTSLKLTNLYNLRVHHRTISRMSQFVHAPLTKSATFLVFTIRDWKEETVQSVRKTLTSTSDLIKSIQNLDESARFSCTVGIGSLAWNKLIKIDKPKELHAFKEVQGTKYKAISTPGDIFYHIRSDRRDLCFEFECKLMDLFKDSVEVQDCTIGFRYFDERDLLGFVDGTANPKGDEAKETVYITSEQDSTESALGGSYIVVQKYLHSMKTWKTLPVHAQEAILGRTKQSNVELEDAKEDQQKSHKTLCTIEDGDGKEFDILRDNMPFGSPSSNSFGTYFIGYSRELWIIEKMMERMYIGQPKGLYDRTLDYSTPITGSVFFAPSMDILDSLS